MVKPGAAGSCFSGIGVWTGNRSSLTHPLAGIPQRAGVVQAGFLVVVHQLHQRAEAMAGLHVEIAPVGLEDFIMFDPVARPHCRKPHTHSGGHWLKFSS